MAKHWETFEHTADIGLSADADNLRELYEALAEALAALVCPPEQVRPRQTHTLSVQSDNEETLAVDFLGRLLALLQIERFCVHQVAVTSASTTQVEAAVCGEACDPDRHELGPEIKAVTYHRLDVHQEGGRWLATVILDL